MKTNNWLLGICLATICVVGFSACEKDDPTPNGYNPPPALNPPGSLTPGSDQSINYWIHSVMREVYLWEEDITRNANVNQDPTSFYKSLLSSNDKFSYITPNYQALVDAISGVTLSAGYEFRLLRESEGSNNLVGIITYVIPNTPAEESSLKRGDVFYEINSAQLTLNNYNDLLNDAMDTHTLSLRAYDEANNNFVNSGEITLTTQVVSENPHFLDSVYTLNSGKKVGYYVYNFFAPGTNGNEYDQQMDAIIGSFKNEGISELVLDLRYNGGGTVSSSANLASLIGANIKPGDVFYKNKWNELYQEYLESLANGDDILRGKFLAKQENIGSQINGRVFILTGSGTASASELIINGLKPYMNVILVGETTVGKNVGSITIDDKEDEDNSYGLLPIVLKIYNSNNQSDYGNGFAPDLVVEDLMYPMYELGDTREWLLAQALQLIDGQNARYAQPKYTLSSAREVSSSFKRKPNFGRIILDGGALPIK